MGIDSSPISLTPVPGRTPRDLTARAPGSARTEREHARFREASPSASVGRGFRIQCGIVVVW
jgi:hypothetical protein